jgi:hypothetical protein
MVHSGREVARSKGAREWMEEIQRQPESTPEAVLEISARLARPSAHIVSRHLKKVSAITT